MNSVLITTIPFASANRLPLELLEKSGVQYTLNPYNRKLTACELAELVTDHDVLIAGTEEINKVVFERASNLKFISRVGIGLDNVDLISARERNIKVSYTSDAPAPAVAELTLGHILTLLRSSHVSNLQMHYGNWQRYFGRRLAKVSVGIIGAGRIGSRVLQHLSGFAPAKVFVHDINPNTELKIPGLNLEWVSKETIFQQADVISIHVPLTKLTRNMVDKEVLLSMKTDAVIINTSRGGIVNEKDLFDVLERGHLAGAAIDVFENEPYKGPLMQVEKCILTSHMGSMSIDCRTRMEVDATEEAIRFINGKVLLGEVPESEYEEQMHNK